MSHANPNTQQGPENDVMALQLREALGDILGYLNSTDNLRSTAINWRRLPTEGFVPREEGDGRSVQVIVLADAVSELDLKPGGYRSVAVLRDVILEKLSDIMDICLPNPTATPPTGNSTPETVSEESEEGSTKNSESESDSDTHLTVQRSLSSRNPPPLPSGSRSADNASNQFSSGRSASGTSGDRNSG